MKEIMKSKGMIGFIIFILGITYLNAGTFHYMEEGQNSNLIAYQDSSVLDTKVSQN